MAECRSSKPFLQESRFPDRATECIGIAHGFVPPCNRNTTGICDLMDRVIGCNKVLWRLGLQIRDDPRDEVGEASVAVIRRLDRGYLGEFLESDAGLTALAVLVVVLLEHRCIVAVQMFDVVAKIRAVLFSLGNIPTLKRLTIVVDPDEQPEGVDGLLAFVQSGGRRRRSAAEIHQRENNSVTELAVGSLIYGTHCTERPEYFVTYLRKKKATLRKLLIDASGVNGDKSLDLMSTLVQAICEMTSLEQLTAYWLCKAVDLGLIGNVVASNKSLRTLEVRCRHCCELRAHQCDAPPHNVSVMEPWVTGLKMNRTLERLSVDLSLYTAYECCLFIDAIADNISIVTLTVQNIADNGCLRAVYSRIRDRKIQHRVFVEDHHVGLKDVKELVLFPEASVVTLSSRHFPHPASLCTAIEEMAACSHITALRLRFTYYNRSLYMAATNYISATVTVSDIEVYVNDMREAGDSPVPTDYRLIEALALNRSIRKLKLNLKHLSDRCCELITDSILQNRMLYEVSLEALDEPSCTTFLRCLMPGLASSYSLLVARLPDIHVALGADIGIVHDVTRRNSRLVELASRFVTQDHRDFCTESALPLVSEHPKLLETVAQKAGVTETEADTMIKHLLSLPTFSDVRSWP
ncbi:hypothetical protein MTO96_042337 [Rhipicephalus appendiculatus]